MEFSSGLREIRSVCHLSSSPRMMRSTFLKSQQDKEVGFYIRFSLLKTNPGKKDKHATLILFSHMSAKTLILIIY